MAGGGAASAERYGGLRTTSLCVFSKKLRTVMSSIMRRRSGLMGFSLIGSSCLEVGVLEPLDPQDGASARHLRSFKELLRQTQYARPRREPLPRERVRCVLGMLSSLEVKVFCPT